MITDKAFWDGLLRDAEAILEEIEPTWRERWAEMEPIDRTGLLNVDLPDADRHIADLLRARSAGVLDAAQDDRLDALVAARSRARSVIDAMTASVDAPTSERRTA